MRVYREWALGRRGIETAGSGTPGAGAAGLPDGERQDSGRRSGEVSRRQTLEHWTARLRVCQTPTIGMESGCLSPEEGRVRQEGKFRNSKAGAPTIRIAKPGRRPSGRRLEASLLEKEVRVRQEGKFRGSPPFENRFEGKKYPPDQQPGVLLTKKSLLF